MKLPRETQDDLLNRPLSCAENREMPHTMGEGLELAISILEEIDSYLLSSPVALAVAKTELLKLKKRGTPSLRISIPVGIEVSSSSDLPKNKPPAKKPKAKKLKAKKPTELELLLKEAREKGIDTAGVSSNLEALRERISLFDDLLIEDPTIEKHPKETMKPLSKKPTRLQALAGMAVKKELSHVSSYVSSKFDLGEDQ